MRIISVPAAISLLAPSGLVKIRFCLLSSSKPLSTGRNNAVVGCECCHKNGVWKRCFFFYTAIHTCVSGVDCDVVYDAIERWKNSVGPASTFLSLTGRLSLNILHGEPRTVLGR